MAGDPRDLRLTLRLGGRVLDDRVVRGRRARVDDVPGSVAAERQGAGFVLETDEGRQVVDTVVGTHVDAGAVSIDAQVVTRRWLPRWILEQGDLVLPVLVLTTMVFLAQLELLMALFSGGPAGGGLPEPSPEYIARLLDEDRSGGDRGVVAIPAERPKSGVEVQSYYLAPGTEGPRTKVGGGKRVGARRSDGRPDATGAPAPAAPVVVPGTAAEEIPPEAVVDLARDGEGTLPDSTDDADPAVEVSEGWGLTDWYDTADARADAHEIERQLRLAKQLLRLDPDDPYGLSLRAYYEYLALDMEAARRTYQRILKRYPEDAGAWNNLALTYKRTKDFAKEEELYRVSLRYEPDEPNTMNNLAVCLAHQGRFDEALAIMKRLEVVDPDDPYADLHRAKIYAAMGREEQSYRYLRRSLAAMRKLDTLHNIEYQQDIRVDPAFDTMRDQDRFHRMLLRFYGDRPGGWWTKPGR